MVACALGRLAAIGSTSVCGKYRGNILNPRFFFLFFFPDLRRFVSAHPNQEVERFIGGDAEVTLGFLSCKRREFFGFRLDRVILKTAAIRGEQLVCSFFFYWIGSKTSSRRE